MLPTQFVSLAKSRPLSILKLAYSTVIAKGYLLRKIEMRGKRANSDNKKPPPWRRGLIALAYCATTLIALMPLGVFSVS